MVHGGYLSVHNWAFGNSLSSPRILGDLQTGFSCRSGSPQEQAPCKKRCDGSRCEKSEASLASLVHNDSKRKKKKTSAPAVDRMATHRGEGVK